MHDEIYTQDQIENEKSRTAYLNAQRAEQMIEKFGKICGHTVFICLSILFIYICGDDPVSIIPAVIFFSYSAVFVNGFFQKSIKVLIFQENDFKQNLETISRRARWIAADVEIDGNITHYSDTRNKLLGMIGCFEEEKTYKIWIAGNSAFISAIESYVEDIGK